MLPEGARVRVNTRPARVFARRPNGAAKRKAHSGDAETEPPRAGESDMFSEDGIPDPSQFRGDGYSLRRSDVEEAALPEEGGDGLPTGGRLMAPGKDRAPSPAPRLGKRFQSIRAETASSQCRT